MNDQPSNPLEYAQRPPAIRRWRWRIVFATLAVVLAILAITRGPAVWDRAMLLYWQRQCMNYTAPADQVVYDSAPADAAEAAAGGRGLLWSDTAVGRVPQATYHYFHLNGWKGLNGGECVLFLGGLTSPGGTRRLVMVVCSQARSPENRLQNAITVCTFSPQGWWGGGDSASERGDRDSRDTGPARLKIFAGQIEPGDPSHFTIRFKRLHDGLIEGRLADDGRVHLQFRGSKEDGFDLPLEGQ